MDSKSKNSIEKLKQKVANEANKMMKKSIIDLQKSLEKLLKSNGLWYSSDDLITQYDDMHKKNDHNADQLIIEKYKTIIFNNQNKEDTFSGVVPTDLWSNDDISKKE